MNLLHLCRCACVLLLLLATHYRSSTQPMITMPPVIKDRQVMLTISNLPGAAPHTVEWEMHKADLNGYTTVLENAVFKNVTTTSLTITNASCDLNRYQFRAIVKGHGGAKSFAEPVTLLIAGCVTPADDTVKCGNVVTFSVPAVPPLTAPAILPPAYQWQYFADNNYSWTNISDNATYSGSQTNTIRITTEPGINLYKFRCRITFPNGETITSSEHQITLPGFIIPSATTAAIGAENTELRAIMPPGTSGFRWEVDRGNGYEPVTDSGIYSFSSTVPVLKIKKASVDMNRNRYRCVAANPVYMASEPSFLQLTGPIVPQKFVLTGAIYSQPKGLEDDNPADLTQMYIRASVPLNRRNGTSIEGKSMNKWIWARNFFVQLTYSTNAGRLNYTDTNSQPAKNINNPNLRLVNRLDLLQHAKFNLNLMIPTPALVLTGKNHTTGGLKMFFDPFVSFLSTPIADSPANSFNVSSMMYGGNYTFRLTLVKDVEVELSTKMFWINTIGGGVNPHYNYQYARRHDYVDSLKSIKPVSVRYRPLYNFDALVIYNINTESNSQLFLHYTIYSNLVRSNYKHEKNAFHQIQVGYAVNLVDLSKGLLKALVGK